MSNIEDNSKASNRKLSTNGLSLYETLELTKACNEAEIKKSYRRLALKYHPDKNANDKDATEKDRKILFLDKGTMHTKDLRLFYYYLRIKCNIPTSKKEIFRSVNKAYSVLIDKKKRAFYDKYGSLGLQFLSQMGEDNAQFILKSAHPCVKALLVATCLLTGCCYCFFCYCFCCYNFCCGKCAPEEQDDLGDPLTERMDLETGDPPENVIITQPCDANTSKGTYGTIE